VAWKSQGEKMIEKLKEELEIKNFLSIKHLKWEFSEVNIISGGVAAGKSICIKLLKYFEDIIPSLLSLPYDRFIRNLDTEYFFSNLTNRFTDIFFLSEVKRQPSEFIINYTFSFGEEIFKVTIKNNNKKHIIAKSPFLKKLLIEWYKRLQIHLSGNVTLDGFYELKNIFNNELQKKFNSYLPLRTAFIPASRATLAITSSSTDYYIRTYKDFADFWLARIITKQRKFISILKAKLKTIGESIYLESDDGRTVPLEMASDGQQESAYILMHLDRLCNYNYRKHQSIFIEEPSAYLSPPEQKQIIEFIVRTYNYLRNAEKSVRFFITTCDSYLLDSLNNMLMKGDLVKKYKEWEGRIQRKINIPGLSQEYFSAFYIDHEGIGKNMMNRKGQLIQPPMIKETSNTIKNDAETLSKLYKEFSNLPNKC
jgi:hypothetical protein